MMIYLNTVPSVVRPLAILLMAPLLAVPLHAIPVRVLAWDQDIAAMKLSITDSKGSAIIEAMHPAKRTAVRQVVIGEKPVVIEALDRKDPEGKPFTSEIRFPEGVKQPLVVLLPDAKAATGVRPLVFEDEPSNFAWGSTRFINSTGNELVFVTEKKILALPASWDPIQWAPGGTTRNIEVKLFLRTQPARPIYSSIWESNTEVRTMVFLVPGEDPRLGPVAMKMIAEDRRLINAAKTAAGDQAAAQP